MTDEMIKQKAENLFIRKSCDRTDSKVQAALITAASKMAPTAAILTEEATLEELIAVYALRENTDALDLIGMDPKLVEGFIGYPVDFNNLLSSSLDYESNKDAYDFFYRSVKAKIQEKSPSLEDTPKSM